MAKVINNYVDKKSEVEAKKGDLFMHEDGEVYILATVGISDGGVLYQPISLSDGNRWIKPALKPEVLRNLRDNDFTRLHNAQIIIERAGE